MECRQFDNDWGALQWGGIMAQMDDDLYPDQWSNLKNNLIFVLENCI